MTSTLIIVLVFSLVVLMRRNLIALSVTESVTSTPSYLISHAVPIPIELRSALLVHVLENILLFRVGSHSLLDNFATLSVEHALVSHFLVTVHLIIVHLVSLGNLLTIRASCTFSLGLVNFAYRFAIWAHPCLVCVGLDHELSLTSFWHTVHHSRSHFFHHFVHTIETKHASTEATSFSVEEWIILEGVHHHTTSPKTLEHLVGHLTHLLVHVVSTCKHIV